MTSRCDGRFGTRLYSRIGRLLVLAFMVRLAAFAIFTAFVPSRSKVSPSPDAQRSARRAATLSEAVVDETGFETEPVLKSQGPPSGPGDVKKVDINCLGERILADYSIGTAQTLPLRGVLGGSVYARSLRKQVISCSKDNGSVIIFGEPGTKKDMLAFLIHFHRRVGQLLFVDSGTVSSLGVRIFGRPKIQGLLDLDKEGTLIFNNVHRLNKQLMPALVELAQNGTYWSRKFQETRKSRIKVPALRVRRADIESMVKYQLRILSRTYGKQVPRVEPEALKRLQAYDYPNNVQELFSLIDNAWAHLSDGSSLTAEMLWTAQSPSKLDTFKVNLLDVYPGLRKFLQSNWLEKLNHGFTKYVFAALVILLFIGPQTRDANFGLNIFWAWWWPGILLTYPVLGRFWCAVCPFMIYGEIVQRWRIAGGAEMQKWPSSVEKYGGWFLYVLFFGILMWEELWVLEDTAYLSSCLLLLITFGAMVGSWFFERRIWCRHLCPIGGMNGLYAKLAVTELRAQNGQCKAVCNTFHCYKGGPAEGEGQETDGQLSLRAPGVDFGFPFLFPIPGTKTASQHDPSFPELALLFLLLGAELVLQFGQSPEVLANFESHALIAFLALLFPGLLVYAADQLVRQLCTLFAPERRPPNEFLQLAYSYLPLTWLASLAHYLQLGLVEAGQVLPVAARTGAYFVSQLGFASTASWLTEDVVSKLPSVSFAPEVVAFLQSVTLILAAVFSLQKLNKLGGGGTAPYLWIHQLVVLALTWELWQILISSSRHHVILRFPCAPCPAMACAVHCGDASPGWGRNVTFALSPKSARSERSEESPERSPKTRSECWEAFLVQAKAAQATQCFVFSHRRLDCVASSALINYLQEECEARFADLSFLKKWYKVDADAAMALQRGLRKLRSLSLDGNVVDTELWCQALQAHPGLQHLSLQKTHLDDMDATRLAEVLRTQSLLFSLDLSSNEISDLGASALLKALEENFVLLELCLEGTDTSEEMRNSVNLLLERNRCKYHGRRPISELLRSLRRAQAEAVTCQVQMSQDVDEIASQVPSCATSRRTSPRPSRPGTATSRGALTPAAGDLSRGEGIFCDPELEEEEEEQEEATDEQEMADAVWFDADDGRRLLAELNLRCEAGWRYSAADQEELRGTRAWNREHLPARFLLQDATSSWMVAFRDMIKELQALRWRERQRHEAALKRLAEAQRRFNMQTSPFETSMFEIQQQIEAVSLEVKTSHEQRMTRQAELETAQKEWEVEQEELLQTQLGFQRVNNSLRLRHQEIGEALQAMRREQNLREGSIEALLADNERCRRCLHAARFETETERFVPHATLERLKQDPMVNIK
eukprot:s200_g44.t1